VLTAILFTFCDEEHFYHESVARLAVRVGRYECELAGEDEV
jgi:hypothetical protein